MMHFSVTTYDSGSYLGSRVRVHPIKDLETDGPPQKFNVASKRKIIAKGGGGGGQEAQNFLLLVTLNFWDGPWESAVSNWWVPRCSRVHLGGYPGPEKLDSFQL